MYSLTIVTCQLSVEVSVTQVSRSVMYNLTTATGQLSVQ